MKKLTGIRKRLMKSIDNVAQLCLEGQYIAETDKKNAYYTGAIDALEIVCSFIIVDEYTSSSVAIPLQELERIAKLRTLISTLLEDLPELQGEAAEEAASVETPENVEDTLLFVSEVPTENGEDF